MNNFQKYIVILFLGFSVCGFAQTKAKKIDLVSVLKQIEIKHDIKFSFGDKTVENIEVDALYPELSLRQAITQLRLQTGLDFNVLSSRFIVIEKTKTNQPIDFKRLDEVFIQDYLTKGLSKTINGTVEISPQKFGILPGFIEPDIFQTIQTLPGIISADERISNINIRGGTNDQNLILYEGIRMYQTGHFFGLISAFNPYLTEKVDISINGTKAKYGSGVSSIVSIKNTDDIRKNSKFGAGFNLLSIDGFAIFQPTKKTEIQVAARRSYTDALLTPTYDNYFERVFNDSNLDNSNSQNTELQQNERFYFYDAGLKFLCDINEKSKISANVLTFFNQLDYDTSTNQNNNNPEAAKSQLSQKTIAGNITYDLKLNEDTQLDAQMYYSNYILFGNNFIPATTQKLTQENEVKDVGLRFNFLKRLDTNLNLEFGYQFNGIGVSNLEDVSQPNFKSFVEDVINAHGIYGEAEFTSNSKKTYGRIGLRGNYISEFSTVLFEPRFAFSQKIASDFRLEVLGEVKSQSVTQVVDLQQSFFGVEKRRWQLANENNIPIIKSNQLSVGLSYKKKGWLISAEGYTKNVTGISSRTQGFQNQYQLIDATGSYNIRGVDLLVNKQFQKFSTWLSYSYSKNDFEFDTLNDGNKFANNLDIQHVINFSTSYNADNFKISAGFNWHSGRPFTLPSQNQLISGVINFETPNAERVSDYLRADISARYKFQFTEDVKAEVGASIWNILDRKNSINQFYTRNDDAPIIKNNETALGLTPNFSLRLKF